MPTIRTGSDEDGLLRAVAAGAVLVWDIFGSYYYRYDTHERCTELAGALVKSGLLAMPIMGQGRNCSITDAGKAAIAAQG